MDERVQLDDGPELERLKTRVDGGAFRRPPVLPIVAVIALFAGLALGVGFVPKPVEPTPAPSAAASTAPAATPARASEAPAIVEATAAPSIRHVPSLVAVATSTPPKGGTTTTQAVASAARTFGIKSQDVLSIRLVNGTSYSPAVIGWVWEIIVRGPGLVQCGTRFTYPKPAPSYSPEPIFCPDDAEIVIVDFASGEAVLMGDF